MRWPVIPFQIRTVLSEQPLASRVPSGLQHTERTSSTCHSSRCSSFPVLPFQIRTVLSEQPLASRVPSGLQHTDQTKSECPSRRCSSVHGPPISFCGRYSLLGISVFPSSLYWPAIGSTPTGSPVNNFWVKAMRITLNRRPGSLQGCSSASSHPMLFFQFDQSLIELQYNRLNFLLRRTQFLLKRLEGFHFWKFVFRPRRIGIYLFSKR